jgi:hypothetical protein
MPSDNPTLLSKLLPRFQRLLDENLPYGAGGRNRSHRQSRSFNLGVLVEPTSHGYASGGGTGGFSAETSLVLKQVEYKVLSEKGKNLGGPYKSKQAAEKRLKQVEYFQHSQG